MRSLYENLVRYSSKLNKYYARDLVHDAYLVWQTKTGKSLLDEANHTARILLKNLHFNKSKQKYIQRGTREDVKNKTAVRIYKKFVYLDADDEPFRLVNNDTPERIFLVAEANKRLSDSLNPLDRQVLELKLQGYNSKEIEEILNTHNVAITAATKRIKQRINELV